VVGPILGASFDRAVALVLKHWLIFLAGWAVLACTSIFDHLPGTPINDLAGAAWVTVAIVLATRDADPSFKADASLVLRLWATSIWYLVVVLAPPFFVVVISLALAVNGAGSVTDWRPLIAGAIPALTYFAWAGSKWSLAGPVAVLEGRRAFASLRASWAVTRGAFWSTLLLGVAADAITITTLAAGLFIIDVIAIVAWGETRGTNFTFAYGKALITPIEQYVGVASWIAYIRYLSILRSREASRREAVEDIPRPTEA